MKRWPTKLLGEIATVQMGQSPPGNTYNSEGVGLPFFQGKAEFGEEHPTPLKWCSQPTRIAESGDILLSVRAPVGPTNFAIERCCIGRGLATIRGNQNECNQRYIRYYLKRFESDIAARGVGSTFTAINRNDVERLELPVPPLAEQERIVKLLDEADELRKLRAQADRRSADLIPALFHEMFGDPVSNRLNWPVCELGSLCKVMGGGTPSKKQPAYWTGKIPWVSPKDMSGDEVHDSEDHISEQAIKESATNLIPADSILVVTRSGILKHTLPIAINSIPVTINQDIKAFIPTDGCESSFFAVHLRVLAPAILGTVRVGATVQNLETEALRRLPVLNPPLPLQQEFAQRVSEIRELEAAQAASRQRTEHLFQSMLHRAFNQAL